MYDTYLVKYLAYAHSPAPTQRYLLVIIQPPTPTRRHACSIYQLHIKHISTVNTREDLPYFVPDIHFSKSRESKARKLHYSANQATTATTLTPLPLAAPPTANQPHHLSPIPPKSPCYNLPLRTDFKSSQPSFNIQTTISAGSVVLPISDHCSDNLPRLESLSHDFNHSAEREYSPW